MSFFLKVSNQNNSALKGKYIQIYESYYDNISKSGKNRCYKSIGYYNDIVSQGISDPIAYYKDLVISLNTEAKAKKENEKIKKIGDNISKNLGYLIAKNILNKLNIKDVFNFIYSSNRYAFDMYSCFESLVYSRLIDSKSKLKTYEDVFPLLLENSDISLDQIYLCVKNLGMEYQKIVELLNHKFEKAYGKRNTDNVFFDCTNYYFEIDTPFEDKQFGMSKENQKAPIIGMGLLLDNDLIPISFRMYPGNQSEKPMIRKMINEMKEQNSISGRTIQIADKGLNCAQNIVEAYKNGDGFIYSQSVNTLPKKIEDIVLDEYGYDITYDKNGEIVFKIKDYIYEKEYEVISEDGRKSKKTIKQKMVIYYSRDLERKKRVDITKKVDKAMTKAGGITKKASLGSGDKYINLEVITKAGEESEDVIIKKIDQAQIEHDLSLCGYNILLTSEIEKDNKDIYEAYHKLWKIEETFRALKSNLDARPIYHRNKESIYGHFLICYTAIFIIRLLELKEFKNELNDQELFGFIKETNCVLLDGVYYNTTRKNNVLEVINERVNGKYDHLCLKDKDIEKMMSFSFNNTRK